MNYGIYIQVPFCQTKCTYCNFHTGVVSKDRYEPYAQAVCREIAETLAAEKLFVKGDRGADGNGKGNGDRDGGACFDTVYFGGGTPSLLDPTLLGEILTSLCGRQPVEGRGAGREITIEADPETVTGERALGWLAAGFNRVSLGSQSFEDRELQAAGRMHRRADIFKAVETLRGAGFRNVSLDLIAGLAHQTRESWERSVGEMLRIGPEHVSIYMLEVDEGSRLGRESLAGGARYSAGAIPSDDAMAEFYESACARLDEAGYGHYEISNWALRANNGARDGAGGGEGGRNGEGNGEGGRAGWRSRHNLKYWRREPYFGFGAGAHSFDGKRRWANVHDAARYVECAEQGVSPREQMETVTPAQALEEEFFLGLRQLEGIDLARIERDCDASVRETLAELRARMERLRAQGVIEVEGSRVRLAPGKLTVSNEVLVELLG